MDANVETNVEQLAKRHGFQLSSSEALPEIEGTAFVMRHTQSGARLLYLQNDDPNKAFAISFKTPAADDTGVFHILEHSVLCGSDRFPVKEPFVNLLKSSMQTFLNAMTFPDKTMYPVASTNEQDLLNLMDVYLDAVFHPAIYTDPSIFQQEGWHLELNEDGTPFYNGVVYNEMKGALSDPESVLYDSLSAALFPDTTYVFESGGTPQSIPTLTYEQFIDTHRRHYRPDNSFITLYGDLDIDRFLGFIDEEYLSPLAPLTQEPLTINPLATQKPLITTKVRKPMVTAPENACVALGFVVGSASDRKRMIATEILLDAIMGSNEAPMKRAILQAGLASDTSAYLSDSVLQPFAVFQLRGSHPDTIDEFTSLVTGQARELAEGGLDRNLIEAALSHAEFVMRERNFGISDGVALAMASLSGWLYDDNLAVEYLRYEKVFKELRQELKTGYFESLLRELVLESTHYASVEVVPTDSLDEPSSPLSPNALPTQLDEVQREAIKQQVETLRERQERPDSPENLAKLPQLPVSALQQAPQEAGYHLMEDTILPCLRHDVHTHGIVYVYRYFSLESIPFEDMPYVTVLAMVLGKLDTAHHTAAELDTLIQSKLGNLSFFTDIYEHAERPDLFKTKFVVSASALSDQVAFTASLPNEILVETDFSNTAKIEDILTQKRIAIEQAYVNSGHSAAMGRVASYYSSSAVLREQLSGLDFYFFLKDLLQHFPQRKQELVDKLKSLSNAIFIDTNCLISFTGTDAELSKLWDAGMTLGNGGAAFAPVLSVPQPEPKNEAIIVPSDVTYTAMGFDRRVLGQPYHGAWLLVSRILSYDYLWNEVRVKGGAYGAGFQTTRGGNLRFYSFRDPHVDETIAIYEKAGAWLQEFNPNSTEFDGYVVSTTAGIDAPLKPRELIRRQDGQFFCSFTPDMRLALRHQVVTASLEEVQTLGQTVSEVSEKQLICTIGNATILEGTNRAFHTIELMESLED